MGDTTTSRKAAIRRLCAECMGADRSLSYTAAIRQTVRMVRECTAPACPLYPWRLGAPIRHDASEPDGEEAEIADEIDVSEAAIASGIESKTRAAWHYGSDSNDRLHDAMPCDSATEK